MTVLGKLQEALQHLYEIELDCSVNEFLITDAALAAYYDNSRHSREIREKLLVEQREEDLHLSLYIDAEVLSRLYVNDPLEYLHSDNFGDFMLALEGVSHFVYVAWNASFDRCFSLLELELQAEIDKFILTSRLIGQQRAFSLNALHHHLFAAPRFDSQLSADELQRYRDANHYAAKYCRHIHHRYLRDREPTAYIKELRRFYRLPNIEKIAHINRLPN